jgi:hypothetical protein
LSKKNIYHELLEKYGQKNQIIKSLEELGELGYELEIFLEIKPVHHEKIRNRVQDEIIDVWHMTNQLILIFFKDRDHFRQSVKEKQTKIREKYL